MAEVNPQRLSSPNLLGQLLEKLPSRPSNKVVVLCLAVFSVCFGVFIVQDFSMPLGGGGDYDIWEYNGYYLAKNLSFNGFLHIDLNNNQVFYPYGVSSVFQSWGLERDLYYAALYSLFGTGPWLQFYYCLSVLIAIVGAYLLLEGDYGWRRASLAAVAMTVFNFYAFGKFPIHLGYATVHWMALSIIADFLIVRRVVLNRPVSLKLLCVRAALLTLCLGHDLGYIAGFSLTSFTISLIYIGGLLLFRSFRGESLKDSFFSTLSRLKNEFFESRWPAISLSVAVVCGYLYVPLVLQIIREVGHFDFTDVQIGAWWVSPFRLMLPFLPFVPWQQLEKVFKDIPEFILDGSVGLFLVLVAAAGLWQLRRRLPEFVPLLVLLTICVFFHPVYFTVIKIFPWFSYFRVGGRSSVIYPVVFCLLALELRPPNWRGWNFVALLLAGLATAEFVTYRSLWSYRPYRFDSHFFSYMQRVKEQPGEAVLDWPFCAIGGNGIGESTCPLYGRNAALYALRRFHGKKVMGEYFGRLHPEQVRPYVQAGWPALFHPDNKDVHLATRQTRCFSADEWVFFDHFYRFNDFAGINLHTELLPSGCAEQFHRRYGAPVDSAVLPRTGRVEFLPKPATLRAQVDPERGRNLRYVPAILQREPTTDFSRAKKVELIGAAVPSELEVIGLGGIEKSAQGTSMRRAATSGVKVFFTLDKLRPLVLDLKFYNPTGNRQAVLTINGREVTTFDASPNETIARRVQFRGLPEGNHISFSYSEKPRSPLGIVFYLSGRLLDKLSGKPQLIDMSNKQWFVIQFQKFSISDSSDGTPQRRVT